MVSGQAAAEAAEEDDDIVYGLYAAVVLADVRMACAWKRLLRPLLQHRHWQQGAYQVGTQDSHHPSPAGRWTAQGRHTFCPHADGTHLRLRTDSYYGSRQT